MEFAQGYHGGAHTVDLTGVVPERASRKYRRLTLADRAFIQAARSLPAPVSMRGIAAELGVAPSTVSREITAHSVRHGRDRKYVAEVAHYRALAVRPRPRPGKLTDPRLRARVVAGLNQKHSPQQVAHRLRVDFPDHPELQVSHETIYQALYVQGKGALRHELTVEKALRSGRTGRVPQSKLPRRSNRPWLAGARLSDRPAEVDDRAVPGHWEGDLVVGPGNSGLVTLVERQTRFALVGRLPGVRDSMTVVELMQRMIRGLPSEFVRTITWDQGQEMAQHHTFTIATGCRMYFWDPHSPWQRGTNENLNGLIRDFYPKGTNFNQVTDEEIAGMQDLLNDRPRQTGSSDLRV
ncbi:IS30-like element ISCg2 family transposase [Leucobacter ruminantium]|uniref:IS30 family transposase n=1 Tax=Leucobacter ruminantium TaxID=1289170 RepID=A0A939RZB5_9MICO|nr:IS30 family transposase [Leucobacter ruminantium]MBO1806558.1 IS30 family transposase [Leucobacter ruminantium]